MTITVANTSNTSTFQYWVTRTNELAYHMSGAVMTTDATGNTNIASGNTRLNGTLSANVINIGNSSVNTTISTPNTVQKSSGSYFLNANGSWTNFTDFVVTSTSVPTTGVTLIDSFATTIPGVDLTVTVNDGSTSFIISKIILIQDGTNVYTTQYAYVNTAAASAVFSANINAGSVRLYVTSTIPGVTAKVSRINV